MEEFLNGNILIRLIEDDYPILKDFQCQSGLNWASGDCIDSQLTRDYIQRYNNNLLVHCEAWEDSGKLALWIADPDDFEDYTIIRLPEILGYAVNFTVEEDDVLNLIAE